MWFLKKKSAIKAVFFDIGGVVIQARLDVYLEMGSEIFNCPPEVLQRHAGPHVVELECGRVDSQEFWARLGASLEQSGDGKAVPAWKFKGFWEGVLKDSARIDEQVMRMCKKVRNRAILGALSNTIKEHAVFLKNMGVYEPFRPCVLSCQVGQRKPDADIYHTAAKLARVKPEACLFVDDLEENIEAAQELGMHVHHFKRAEELELDLRERALL